MRSRGGEGREGGGGPAFPLVMAAGGEKVRLVEVRGGRCLNGRLAEMGLTPGVVFVVFCNSGGPMILDVRGSRLAIGRRMAHKMMVVGV